MAYRDRPQADKGLYPLPGNAGFEVRWLVRGKMHCKRLRGYTKTEARNWRNEEIAKAKSGRSPAVPGRLMFADLVRLKRTQASAKQNRSTPEPSRFLADYFGFAETTNEDGTVTVTPGWRVVEITDERVSEYTAARLAAGVKLDTMQADLRWLRHAFNLAVKAKRLTRDQCPTIEVHDPHNVRSNFPEPDQLERIRAALPVYLRGVVLFAELTAWRIKSMVLSLRWEHVDWRSQMIRLPAELSKNKKPVVFPFGPLPDLKQLLEHQLAGAEPVSAAHVFYGPQGRAIDYKVMRKAWKAACRKAKCPGTWLHDLCRVGARNLRRAGVSVDEVMKLGRWKTPSMFQRYNIIDEEDLNASVKKLAVKRATEQEDR
jgi:integrase